MDTPSTTNSTAAAPTAIPLLPSADRAAIDEARARMDRQREELKRKLGEVDFAADIIREIREA